MRSTWRVLVALAALWWGATWVRAQNDGGAQVAPASAAQEDNSAAKAHEALTALREAVVKAVNAQDIEGLLQQLDEDVVAVWQDGTVSRGHEGVRAYYQKTLGGENAVLKSYTVEPKVAELTILHGDDAGVAYGTVLAKFEFKNGRQFELEGPWSATLVRKDGQWKIGSFHASAGLFDNPLLKQAQAWWMTGVIASLAVGLLVGAAVIWWVKRGK